MRFVLILRCSVFAFICSFHVNLLFKCIPIYFTQFEFGIWYPQKYIFGQPPFLKANVTWVGFSRLMQMIHFFNQFEMKSTYLCNILEASVKLLLHAIKAVSSAYIAVVISSLIAYLSYIFITYLYIKHRTQYTTLRNSCLMKGNLVLESSTAALVL